MSLPIETCSLVSDNKPYVIVVEFQVLILLFFAQGSAKKLEDCRNIFMIARRIIGNISNRNNFPVLVFPILR